MPSNKPEYQAEYIRKHYQKNKDYYKSKAKERKLRELPRRKAIISRYKLWKGCVDCGYKAHAEALDFDHVRGEKKFNISEKLSSVGKWKDIKDEIRKCEVRCANCHRVITASRRKD